MFYFQSYSTFSWLISFNKAYKYDLKSTDFVEFYSFVLLFLAMMISIYIEDKKHSEDTTTNEIRNILVINLICYLLTFAFTKIPGTSPMEIFMYLVLEYILVLISNYNSFQLYGYLLNRKLIPSHIENQSLENVESNNNQIESN